MTDKKIIDVSIIIVNWNTKDFLEKCLESIYSQVRNYSYEVIVVDNNSSDNSAEMIKNEFPEVCLIENKNNEGFGRANNQGYEISKGRYLLILNPDTEILEQAIDTLIQFMEENPHVGVCGPQCVHPDGVIQVTWAYFPSLKTISTNNVSFKDALAMITPLKRFTKSNAVYSNEGFTVSSSVSRQKVDYVLGQCMLTRKALIDQTGLFDEEVFMYEEEPDLCYRIFKRGYETWFVPEAKIIHHERKSIDQVSNPLKMDIKWFVSARSHFFKKHHGAVYKYGFLTLGAVNSAVKVILFSLFWVFDKSRRKYYRMKMLFHCYFVYWVFAGAGKSLERSMHHGKNNI